MIRKEPFQPARVDRPLHTVLIGTSLEDGSDRVVRAGLAVARAAGARVYLVHATAIEPVLAGLETRLGPDFVSAQLALREERLHRQIERLGIAEPELSGAKVVRGSPQRILIDAARTAGAGLIVVGATGSGPFAAELLGSTADRVLCKATCPVLVVRGELAVPPRSVLAPVDLSAPSGDAFRCGLDLLAQVAKGEEIRVRAVFALSFLDSLAWDRQAPEAPSLAEVEPQVTGELQRFVREHQPEAPFALETAVLPGEARAEILHEIVERPYDLVLLGTHGRGGLDRLVLGSVAATVARKAPCSVLMISPEAAFGEGIAEAILARTTPAWHREPTPVI